MSAANSSLAERTITVNGLRLATAVNTVSRAALARPALVVLPAAGFTLAAYRAILERFGPERRVAALDWPGFGASSRPAATDFTYGAPAYAALLDSWLTAVGATRPVLCGNGIGGTAALLYTLAHPTRVAGLALVAPWGFAAPGPLRALLVRALGLPWLLARVEPTLASLALGPANPATRTILAARHAARRASDHHGAIAAEAALWRSERTPIGDLATRAGTLDTPALVVRGALDPLVSAFDTRRATECLGAHGALQVVLPDAGHLPWLQQPEPFMHAVRGLLETIETT